MIAAKEAVLLLSIVGLLCAWGYFRRFRISRPPLGTFGLGDVAMLLVAVVVVPFLYLIVPVVFSHFMGKMNIQDIIIFYPHLLNLCNHPWNYGKWEY